MLSAWSASYSACAERATAPDGRAEHLTHYILIRRDLPLGLLAANVAHAAGESSPGALSPGTYAIVLACADEGALRAVAARLELAGVPIVRVIESDPPYADQLMAIGLAPGRKEDLRRHLSSLPLLR